MSWLASLRGTCSHVRLRASLAAEGGYPDALLCLDLCRFYAPQLFQSLGHGTDASEGGCGEEVPSTQAGACTRIVRGKQWRHPLSSTPRHPAAGLLNTVVIGCVNVGSTLVSIATVDRLGRRMLFLEGGIQMIAANVIVGVLVQRTTYVDPGNDAMAAATLAMICIFVAGFAWSWGPLGWLVPSEIQPLETRTSGTAISTASNFLVRQCARWVRCPQV